MKTITLIIMVAIVLEALVEYVKTFISMIENREYKTAITQGITIAMGVFLAIAFNLQLFNNAMSEFYEGLHINPTLDMILTGILFSRGANYFSDFVSRLTHPKEEVLIGEEVFEDEVEPQTDKDDEIEDLSTIDEYEVEEEDA